MLEVDLQPFHGLDRQIPLGHDLALAHGFVGLALALRRLPRQVALALLVAFLVQILHRLEGHRAAADDGQVVARFQLRALVGLVAAAEQGEVAAAADLAAHRLDVGDFVAPGFLAAEVAFLLLVVQVVVAVVGGQQFQLVAGHQVGLVAGAGLARDQAQVLSGIDRQVAPGIHAGALLGDLVFLVGDLPGLAVGMLLVRRRRQGHVAPGGEGDVAARFEGAGHCAEVAPGADVQVPPGTDFGAELGHAL
ncbi:hypothetical protein PSAE76110_31590 [Pseudomonas aeruginosa]